MVSNTKRGTLSIFCNISSVHLFRFIIDCLFLYIIVLFLIGCCNFVRHKSIFSSIYLCKVITSRYYPCKSYNRHFKSIFYQKLAQLLIRDIIIEKIKNPLWGVFSHFGTRVPTPHEQPFLHFLIFPPYFCSYLPLLALSCLLLYCSYLDIFIFYYVIKFNFN